MYLQWGYPFNKMWEATFDVFNLLDSQDADIDYYYVSRLPGEPATGLCDRHTHQSGRENCVAVSRCTSDFQVAVALLIGATGTLGLRTGHLSSDG